MFNRGKAYVTHVTSNALQRQSFLWSSAGSSQADNELEQAKTVRDRRRTIHWRTADESAVIRINLREMNEQKGSWM